MSELKFEHSLSSRFDFGTLILPLNVPLVLAEDMTLNFAKDLTTAPVQLIMDMTFARTLLVSDLLLLGHSFKFRINIMHAFSVEKLDGSDFQKNLIKHLAIYYVGTCS